MPTPEIVILGENPHVAHHEPNQPKGVDDVADRVDVLELLRAFLEEILVSVHDEHHGPNTVNMAHTVTLALAISLSRASMIVGLSARFCSVCC